MLRIRIEGVILRQWSSSPCVCGAKPCSTSRFHWTFQDILVMDTFSKLLFSFKSAMAIVSASYVRHMLNFQLLVKSSNPSERGIMRQDFSESSRSGKFVDGMHACTTICKV